MRYETLALEQYRELTKLYKAVYQAWDKTKAISIVYTGAQATATVEVEANGMILCAPAATPVRTIDLTAAATDTLAEVVADINTALGASGWAAVLGDQFDGTDLSLNLTIIAPTSVKTTAVWFVNDTNLQVKITVPAVTNNKQIILTKVLGCVTGTGASLFKVYDGSTKVWEETAGTTTVEKVCSIPALTITAGNQCIVKVSMATTLTAGYLVIGYNEKFAAPYTVY